MLKALERAIVEQGGDPAELERIRQARKILAEYRRLRDELGLTSFEHVADRHEVKIDERGR